MKHHLILPSHSTAFSFFLKFYSNFGAMLLFTLMKAWQSNQAISLGATTADAVQFSLVTPSKIHPLWSEMTFPP
jgi:hypothetical protein